MHQRLYTLTFLVLLSGFISYCQNAVIYGVVLDDNQQPVEDVNIRYNNDGTTTNEEGGFVLEIPSNKDVTLTFSHISLKSVTATFNLKPGERFEFNPVLDLNLEQIEEVVINSKTRKRIEGITTVSPKIVRTIPGANQGIENILKTLPGVRANNE